ncbi:MAG TPA: hypothetical protein PLX66_02225 [Bacilli bacterium]|nr:hypothetical protein [Bacilli bacterium]
MKMPPREKIHEALTAIADERIILNKENNSAEVFSSDRSKKYLVEWNNEEYYSNDNATYWQGYPGYPVIAVLLMQGKIDYDKDMLIYFKNINWKALNNKFKRDYAKSVESIYASLDKIVVIDLETKIDKIYQDLAKLNIIIKKSRLYPPK